MKKFFSILMTLLIVLASPIDVRAGNSDDDKTDETPASYNVKCEYLLKSPLPDSKGNIPDLTTFSIYVDENNSKYKLTYIDKSGKEVGGKPGYPLSDYQYASQNGQQLKYMDNSGNGGFEHFNYNYKNASNTCPALYVHFMGGEWLEIYVGSENYGSIISTKIDVSKKYTSTDGGNTWDSGGDNTASDKLTEIHSCRYGFLTDIGIKSGWPSIISIRFQKQKNETQNKVVYNIYFETEENGQMYTHESFNITQTSASLIGDINGQKSVVYHSMETIKEILDGSTCKDASEVYLYHYGEWSGYRRFDVTTDYQEAYDYSLDGVYDGASGTELLNAKAAYDKALQDLKDAIQKHGDNNWADQFTEECQALFGGILDGTNDLVNKYNEARERLKTAWKNFDFSNGDEVLNKFKTYRCGQGEPIYGCEVIPASIRTWIKDTLNLVKYIALALVIVLGILDFLKAAGSGEAEAMKKAGSSFLKRIIAVIILFLLPLIVELILNLIEIYGADSTCL